MLLIPCPWCGPRGEIEFVWGGEAQSARPEPAGASDAVWGDYLFARRNAKGPQAERWLHVHGCRQWFTVVRDTTSHVIAATGREEQAPPGEVPG